MSRGKVYLFPFFVGFPRKMGKSALPLRNSLFSVKVEHFNESNNIVMWQVLKYDDDVDVDDD